MYELNLNLLNVVGAGASIDTVLAYIPDIDFSATAVDDTFLIAGVTWAALTLVLATKANGHYHHQYGYGHYAKFAATSFIYMGAVAAGTCYLYEQVL